MAYGGKDASNDHDVRKEMLVIRTGHFMHLHRECSYFEAGRGIVDTSEVQIPSIIQYMYKVMSYHLSFEFAALILPLFLITVIQEACHIHLHLLKVHYTHKYRLVR
jgi:hypothetical protein